MDDFTKSGRNASLTRNTTLGENNSMQINEVEALQNLFLSIFDNKADHNAEVLVEYYPYETSINPFRSDEHAPKLKGEEDTYPAVEDSRFEETSNNDEVSKVIETE